MTTPIDGESEMSLSCIPIVMIQHEKFVIAHIGKTGGDACKQITAAMKLDGVTWERLGNPKKHLAPDKVLDLSDRDLILTFRRLPAREVSWYHHLVNFQRAKNVTDLPRWLINQNNGERDIKDMTRDGKHAVKFYIRSESLLQDLLQVYSHYFDLTAQQIARAKAAKTKRRQRYDHDLSKWLNDEQIAELYRVSPTWSEHERRAYAGI